MNDFEIKKGAWAPEVCLQYILDVWLSADDAEMGRAHRGHRAQEDVVLVRLVEEHGTKNWSIIAKGIPGRTGKSCRIRYVPTPSEIPRLARVCSMHARGHRWYNQLAPDLRKDPFTPEEDEIIIRVGAIHQRCDGTRVHRHPQAVAERGHRWSQISKLLPGRYDHTHDTRRLHHRSHRTDNAVKNHWNSSLKKRRNSYGSRKSALSGIRSLSLRGRTATTSTRSTGSGASARPDDATSADPTLGVFTSPHDPKGESKLAPGGRKSLAARAAATLGTLLDFEDHVAMEGYHMEGMTHEGMAWEGILDQAVDGAEELAATLNLSSGLPPPVPRRYASAPLLGKIPTSCCGLLGAPTPPQ